MDKDTFQQIIQKINAEEKLYKNYSEYDYKEDINSNIIKLIDQISNCDALQLLGGMAFYGFNGVVDKDGRVLINNESVVKQSQLELVQGIALSCQRGEGIPQEKVIKKILEESSKIEVAYNRINSREQSKEIETLLYM